MKYMQPHLVNRMNEEADMDRVEAEWHDACDAYHDRLLDIRDRLPEATQLFMEVVMHGGEMKRLDWHDDDFPVAQVQIRFDDEGQREIMILEYELECPVEGETHWGSGFSKGDRSWLYDEFDIDEQGHYVHSVLFSDGLEAKITFKKMTWLRAEVKEQH